MTRDAHDITDFIEATIERNKAALGIRTVEYASDDIPPGRPALVITPAVEDSEYDATGIQVMFEWEIAWFIYGDGVQSHEQNQKRIDRITTQVRDHLNLQAQASQYGGTRFGGILLDGLNTRIEYGSLELESGRIRVNRGIFRARTKARVVD